MAGINPDLWDFPHAMTLKVMGHIEHPLEAIVLDILNEEAIEHDKNSCRCRTSSKGNYVSVSVDIRVINKDEVTRLYQHLHRCPQIKLVL